MAISQSAIVKEEIYALDTYGFGKPNPVPIIAENPKIAPYFKFEEYEHSSKKKDWKVVTLENDYIKVFILPEIGGKVWGAIEKSTGEEFLYKNEVIKFRNIAMRGPWTSGGIEFNFGIIGHHPSTATPVDYVTRTNDDGSVSCFVGNTDLPSNTTWSVEIRLEKDKAYFETNASWYNASQLNESYYNWMTAAAVATNDLEFYIPGNAYVEHNGDAHSWPIDEQGRDLSLYKNNNFGPAKSYHIVGEYNDFFGGYYRNRQFGFGQWARYEEMPGQKLWLWALSRSGGIWEDLLTDTDGQYIEFQAGRLFDQYSGGAINPISQVGFDPYVMDRWHELWFPYKEIGGMVDASEHGVLNVEINANGFEIGLNALQKLDKEIQVKVNGKIVFSEKLNLAPMEVFSKKISAQSTNALSVAIIGTELSYIKDDEKNRLKRPFFSDKDLKVSETEKLFHEGLEAIAYRDYTLALEKLTKLVTLDPSHRDGLVQLSELAYRATDYSKALEYANRVLQMDTYNSGANYRAGIAYRAVNDTINALESLGWAARDVKYRSVSFTQMATLYLASKNYQRAMDYARKALDYNTFNLNARKVLLVAARKLGDKIGFDHEIKELLKITPLDHFALLEKHFIDSKKLSFEVAEKITNEFPAETSLSLALQYQSFGLSEEMLNVLQLHSKNTKNQLWSAYILRQKDVDKSKILLDQVVNASTEFVFPYRRETIPVLEWASHQNSSWKLKYYLAQNYLTVGLIQKGKALMKTLGNAPDTATFYLFRAKILNDAAVSDQEKDYLKAQELSPKDWKTWEELIQFYLTNKEYEAAINISSKAHKKFPNNYNIGLAHAKSLLNTGRYSDVIRVLRKVQVLPYEHASESRKIYEEAHIALAESYLRKGDFKKAIPVLEQSKKWPENIGVGKPYEPDERLQDYLLAICYGETDQIGKRNGLLNEIVVYTNEHIDRRGINHLFGLLALKKLGRENEIGQMRSKLEVTDQNKVALALYSNETDNELLTKEKHNIPETIWKAIRNSINY
tara:strand:- start:21096 stop:24158 length:3063 start_codon:yes stop_codon:yes gene_type:complete